MVLRALGSTGSHHGGIGARAREWGMRELPRRFILVGLVKSALGRARQRGIRARRSADSDLWAQRLAALLKPQQIKVLSRVSGSKQRV